MDISQIIPIVAALKASANAKTRDAIKAIINLAYQYPYHNKRFTFSIDKNIDDEVNRILVELTDSIIYDIEYYSYNVQALVDDDSDKKAIFAIISRKQNGENLTERLDKHGTRLKGALEAFLAVGFANSLSANQVETAFIANITNPFGWELLKKAYSDPLYEADAIKRKGYTFGKDIDRNIFGAIGLVATQALIESFNITGTMLGEKEGMQGWTTERGSNYDCPHCDSMVGIVHPMTEIFYGWHPRCMCRLVLIGQE